MREGGREKVGGRILLCIQHSYMQNFPYVLTVVSNIIISANITVYHLFVSAASLRCNLDAQRRSGEEEEFTEGAEKR